MIMNLQLLISLGITLLLFGALFLYVRHSVSNVNTKLISLFRIVEEEVERNNKLQNTNMRPSNHPNNTVTVTEMNTQSNNNEDTDDSSSYTDFEDEEESDNESHISYVKENLIEVSSEEPEKDDIKIVEDVNMNEIEVPKTPTFDTVTKGSLNGNITQHHTDDEKSEGEDEAEEVIIKDISSYTPTENTDTEKSDTLDTLDISKLPVAKLRNIVEDKSLHENPKKLKKAQLVELLKQH